MTSRPTYGGPSGERVWIGSEEHGLVLFDVQRVGDEIWWCSAGLRVPGLIADKERVSGHYAVTFQDLISFFEQMEADWRGWEGPRAYESYEHDLRIEATHLARQIRLAVTLAQTSQEDGWHITAVVHLDPGEELSQATANVRALLEVRRRKPKG